MASRMTLIRLRETEVQTGKRARAQHLPTAPDNRSHDSVRPRVRRVHQAPAGIRPTAAHTQRDI